MNDAERHAATHVLDEQCCDVLRHCTAMIDAAYDVGLQVQLAAIADATRALHAKAAEVHAECAPALCPARSKVPH